MPVIIENNLPAKKILDKENIFTMSKISAAHQDIRPLQILILNLMPNKIVSETQLLRLLSNAPLQIEITLMHMESHHSKHTSGNHLSYFYKTFNEIKSQKFDGMIITGAPVENFQFEEVDYWPEMETIMEWAKSHVFSTIFICWAAQAGLYHHFGIHKYQNNNKVFGVFAHKKGQNNSKLFKGFDDIFFVPHSRHTKTRKADVLKQKELQILAESREAGPCIIESKDHRQIFITGHLEYDRNTLRDEYRRDRKKGLKIGLPKNYFPDDDPSKKPRISWHGSANLFYYNWLNFYVYQETPYDLNKIAG